MLVNFVDFRVKYITWKCKKIENNWHIFLIEKTKLPTIKANVTVKTWAFFVNSILEAQECWLKLGFKFVFIKKKEKKKGVQIRWKLNNAKMP